MSVNNNLLVLSVTMSMYEFNKIFGDIPDIPERDNVSIDIKKDRRPAYRQIENRKRKY